MRDNFLNENYTFTKDTVVNNEVESSLQFDFYGKNNIVDVLRSVLEFLQASGYPYVSKLVAVKDSGEEYSSDEDIDEEVLELLNQVVEDLDMAKKKRRAKNGPKLEVVVSNEINDNNDKDNPSSD